MSYQQDFINKIVPYAQKSQKMYGVFASVTISQACWESAYGTYQGAVVQQDHNLFGIKYAGNHCPDIKVTKGSKVGDGEGYYCHYENIGDSCIDHGYFLKHNSRYTESGTFNAKNGKDQLKCIMNAGYAESAYYDGACKIIDTYNLYQYDNVVDNSKIIESACNWAVKIANDDTHGYDQANRWGTPDYDCSSLVISAYEQAGIKVKEAGATYTGNMKNAFLKCGFKVVGLDNLQRGDVLLNEVHHTALYLGNGKMVQASINENGGVTGGQPGDQTGREIWIAPYKNYPWDFALRLEGGSTGGGSSGGGSTGGNSGEVYNAIEKSYFNTKRLKQEQIDFLKSLSFGDSVKIKQCFQRNKRIIGSGINGKRLTMTYGKFIIDSVNKSGCILLKNNKETKHILYTIKPDYIEKI